jgi:uncharacterized Rmd1/YagE family protein
MKDALSTKHRCCLYKDLLQVNYDGDHVFVFSYGAFVAWGITQDRIERFLRETKPFWEKPLDKTFFDNFGVAITGTGGIKGDIISLISDEILEKLALSHGMAQSIKLQEFEARAQSAIENTAHIPLSIAKSGKTYLSRKQISKMRGRLYIAKSDINLRYDLLDTPEFFWEYPELEHVYMSIAKYLDIRSRIEILNKKIEIIRELFSMLADEQSQRHAFALEWIVILLIGLEILLFLLLEIVK